MSFPLPSPSSTISRTPTCDRDGAKRKPLVEELERVTADELGRGIEKLPEGESIEIKVELQPDLAGGRRSIRIRLTTQTVGFGRRWIAECPSCRRPVRNLHPHPESGLACWRCVGATRYAQRNAHRAWYRQVGRPAIRAARLQAAAGAKRRCRTTLVRLHAEAARWLGLAQDGLDRLGPAHPSAYRPYATEL